MVPLVFLINGLTKGDWLEALLFAVAVAVGLTPEMLPMIVTVNLAKGAIAMSRKKVIVKRLNAIQNFGAMDVLCTDKTGTLTQDQMILEAACRYAAARRTTSVLEYAYLNSHYQSGLKNLLDVAVLQHGELEGSLKARGAVQEDRRDAVRFRAAADVGRGRARRRRSVLICKGAVEEVFAVCTHYELDGETAPLDESHLAPASRRRQPSSTPTDSGSSRSPQGDAADPGDILHRGRGRSELLGYIAFLDPPKETRGRRDCRAAGRRRAR